MVNKQKFERAIVFCFNALSHYLPATVREETMKTVSLNVVTAGNRAKYYVLSVAECLAIPH